MPKRESAEGSALRGLGLLGAFGLADVWTNSIAPDIRGKVTPPAFHGIDYAVRRIVQNGDAGLAAFSGVGVVGSVLLVAAGPRPLRPCRAPGAALGERRLGARERVVACRDGGLPALAVFLVGVQLDELLRKRRRSA